MAVGDGGVGDAGGVLGDGRDEVGLRRYQATSGGSAGQCKFVHYVRLRLRSEFASSISVGTEVWNKPVAQPQRRAESAAATS